MTDSDAEAANVLDLFDLVHEADGDEGRLRWKRGVKTRLNRPLYGDVRDANFAHFRMLKVETREGESNWMRKG